MISQSTKRLWQVRLWATLQLTRGSHFILTPPQGAEWMENGLLLSWTSYTKIKISAKWFICELCSLHMRTWSKSRSWLWRRLNDYRLQLEETSVRRIFEKTSTPSWQMLWGKILKLNLKYPRYLNHLTSHMSCASRIPVRNWTRLAWTLWWMLKVPSSLLS